jgi:hypothetical protein
VPTETIKGLSEQNKLELLFNSERTSENKISEQTAKNEDSWISRVEGNRVYLKTGEVWFTCQFCRDVGKPIYFATEADLQRHVLALHTGFPASKMQGERE